ncbi:MAG TPA: RHS repeat-associated core domain-containing protein, partial [Longimicrobium sp.]|nr:RHS repeat-associated core domain-containing protein [Longimicrobium sp.]
VIDADRDTTAFGFVTSASARVATLRDRRGTRHAFTYDAAGKLASARLEMTATPSAADLVTTFQAGESRGVGASVPLAQAHTLLDGPRTDVTDHTMLWLTSQGAPRRIRDAVGGETILNRADANFPQLVTSVLGPNARGDSLVSKSTAVYDARGRVSRARTVNPLGNGSHIDTWYKYDDRWDTPDTITAVGIGDVVMAYDTLNGNLRWRQQGGSSRRVSYGYDSSGQLVRVQHPADAQGLVARDTMGYDAVGNLAWTRTPLGYLTQHYRDALGRDTLVLSPIRADSSSTVAQLQVAGLRSRTAYDLSERVWMTETTGPETRIEWQGITASTKLLKVHAQSVTTRTTYDRGGLPLTVERWTLPDTADINTVTTQYVYDRAGRKRQEQEGMGAWEYFTPDPAGNVVTWTTGRGHQITTEYDAVGRQVRRSVPSVSYASSPQPCWAVGFNDCPFPHFPNSGSGYLVPGDTSVFSYDAAGNLVYAANADAIVSRSYYPGGALRTDSLRIATFGAANYTQHVYGISYRYDAQGRLRALEHPANLAGSVAQADSFSYTTSTGALERVTSRTGLQFSFRYDALGRMRQDSFPGGENTYVYDADGRRKSRGGTVYHDSTRYDARGKALVSWVNGLPNQSTFYNHYSGLGNLVGTDWTNLSNAARNVEEMIVDGLDNVRWHRTANDQTAVAPEHWYVYDPGSTRLKDILFSMPSNAHNPAAYNPDDTHRTYDAGGNAYRGNTIVGANGTGAGYSRTYTASYFSADERLRAYQHNHEIEPTRLNGHAKRGSFAEYFYDPLGRRIQVRTRRDGLCYAGPDASTVDCSGGIERYVWSGDNILWEMRGPGGNTATPEQLNQVSAGGAEYGVVGYTHAGGVDRPLVAWKGSTVVVPHLNWRGLFGKGTDANGYPSAAEIEWPGFQTTASHSRAPTQQPTVTWFGSVLEGKRDAGGQMYMRNRYYDPATGQFTQTDPIGLAGGLNTYGFADGDPVTYSDPYGLSAEEVCPPCAVAAPAAGGSLIAAAEATGVTALVVGAAAAASEAIDRVQERTYVTYTMTNASGQVYSGRTSGYGDPQSLVNARYASHHMRALGYGSPRVDQAASGPSGYLAIRGREQQLIDHYGGSRTDGGSSGNSIRGVAKNNRVRGRIYHRAANAKFGELHEYTGK